MTDPRRTHYADQLADAYNRLNLAAAWLRTGLGALTDTPPEAIVQSVAMNAVQTILGETDDATREDNIRNVCTIHAVSLYEYVKTPKLPHPPPDESQMLNCGNSHVAQTMNALSNGAIASREQLVAMLHARMRDALTIQPAMLDHIIAEGAAAIIALAEVHRLIPR